jgi:hypothetical protein
LRIDVQQGFDDFDPGLGIKGTGWLVAGQHFRPLGNGARDGDALLLAPDSSAWKWFIRRSNPTSASASSGRIGHSAISVTRATFSYAVRLGIRL